MKIFLSEEAYSGNGDEAFLVFPKGGYSWEDEQIGSQGGSSFIIIDEEEENEENL